MNSEAAISFTLKRIEQIEKTKYYYHNVDHTMDVLNTIGLYASIEKINDNKLILLKTASAFHDIGITINYENHEEESVLFAQKTLPQFDYSSNEIQQICELIRATKIPTMAKNKLEELLCDADLDYLGRDDYFEISNLLRKEWNALNFKKYTDQEWFLFQLTFLKAHTYYTPMVQNMRNEGKIKNIKKVWELIK
jgi:hypothetical protein